MKAKILVVEDEPDAIELIEFNLKGAGFEVRTASDGAKALKSAAQFRPDLILLDVMLPEVDGLEVCKIIRRLPDLAHVPIIMLTARAAEIDRVLGLELGADDYLTKPYSPRELLLRINKLLRPRRPATDLETIRVGRLVIDVSRHRVQFNEKAIELTATEFDLLTVLARRKGHVLSRDHLLANVWQYEKFIDTRTVDTHVRRLREKLGEAATYLETVRGSGYRFTDKE